MNKGTLFLWLTCIAIYIYNIVVITIHGATTFNNLIAWIKQFQSSNNLEVDGNIGPKTLAKLEEYGLNS